MPEKPAWLRPHGIPWRRGRARPIYTNAWIEVTEFAATAPTGNPATYGLVSFKNLAIAILPIHDDGTVELVGQHRFPCADYSWEIPEGGGPRDRDPLESARRELAEETGLAARDWREILRVQMSNSVTDELAIGYLATGLEASTEAHATDDTEALARIRAPFVEILAAVMAGQILDVLTVAMVLKASHMAQQGALPPPLARAIMDPGTGRS